MVAKGMLDFCSASTSTVFIWRTLNCLLPPRPPGEKNKLVALAYKTSSSRGRKRSFDRVLVKHFVCMLLWCVSLPTQHLRRGYINGEDLVGGKKGGFKELRRRKTTAGTETMHNNTSQWPTWHLKSSPIWHGLTVVYHFSQLLITVKKKTLIKRKHLMRWVFFHGFAPYTYTYI